MSIVRENKYLIDSQNLKEPAPNWLNVYEVVRAQQGVILFAESHFARLEKSLRIGGVDLILQFKDWKSDGIEILTANQLKDTNIRFDYFFDDSKLVEYRVMPLISHYPTETERLNGVTVNLQFAERKTPNAKITDSKLRGQANNLIHEQGCYETLLVNANNEITEGSRSNFFAILDDVLVTAPPAMVLEGIMRQQVINLANELSIKTELKAIHINDIPKLQSCFITGTSPRILPVNKIDNCPISTHHPLLNQLVAELDQKICNYINSQKP